MAGSSNNSGCLVWIIIIVVAVVGYTMFGNSNSSSGSGTSDSNLSAQATPSNGAVLNGTSGGDAGVRVTAAQGTNAYVKVKSTSGGTVVGFFVRSGSTAEVNVPAGAYSVQFAMGDTRYGTSNRFGSKIERPDTRMAAKPAVTQEQMDELSPGDIVFHKAFGYGRIINLDGSHVEVTFDSDNKRRKPSRKFMFPSAFFQGLLQLGE